MPPGVLHALRQETGPAVTRARPRAQVEGQIVELEAELAAAGDAEKTAVRGGPACNPTLALAQKSFRLSSFLRTRRKWPGPS